MNNNDVINKEIEMINEMLQQAITHGGDFGGPYCTNETRLTTSIENWLRFRNLDRDYTVIRDGLFIKIAIRV